MVVFGLEVEEGNLDIVDGTANIMLKVTGIDPWPWKRGLKYNFIDWFHHIMYVGGALTT
jgi:hypothetical protein